MKRSPRAGEASSEGRHRSAAWSTPSASSSASDQAFPRQLRWLPKLGVDRKRRPYFAVAPARPAAPTSASRLAAAPPAPIPPTPFPSPTLDTPPPPAPLPAPPSLRPAAF